MAVSLRPLRDIQDEVPIVAYCEVCGGEIYRGEVRPDERPVCPDCKKMMEAKGR